MKAKHFYSSVYKNLENITPLKKDCGVLCNGACCKDGEEKTGMLLFPFEDKILEDVLFAEIENSNCEYGEDEVAKIFFCNGTCDRRLRPLACRIFPLVPYKTPDTELKIIMDPRAKNLCPLARSLEVNQLEPVFVKNVKKAMNRIIKLKDGEDYIYMLSEIIDEYVMCQDMLLNK